jgi:hypothetical protein
VTEPSSPTSLYRYYDHHRVLIYVGITNRGIARNVEHNRSKRWWPYVASQEVEHFPTRSQAHAREVELIQRYAPPFNIQHNPGHQEMLAAYLTARDVADSLGGKIPLHPVGVDRLDGTWCLRTEAAHAAIGRLLEHEAPVPVYCDGMRVGRVAQVEQIGLFTLVRIQPRLRDASAPTSGLAHIREIPPKARPLGMRLHRVHLRWAVIAG